MQHTLLASVDTYKYVYTHMETHIHINNKNFNCYNEAHYFIYMLINADIKEMNKNVADAHPTINTPTQRLCAR